MAIVGAGISGISMAAHMRAACPDRSFTILERRSHLGGTWDLFRYPGIRSDSSMHTLGFGFAPWTDETAIAEGAAIRDYLEDVARRHDVSRQIRFDTRVLSADWDSASALWTVTVEDESGRHEVHARFVYLASGYYDYDEPHDPRLPGLERFSGTVAHPQFWPQDLDWTGKRVVVIGSGATAVTIVPSMAERAAHVTMLQRTPTWMAAGASVDRFALRLRRFLPRRLAEWLIREKDVRLHDWFFKLARRKPKGVAKYLSRALKKELGEHYDPRHFQPPYGPWDQRLCLVPDGDLFAAIGEGAASIVTDRIATFEPEGIRLESGETLPADIVVTATGLKMAIGGGVTVSLDGEPIDFTQRWFYRSCLFSNVPNLAVVFGYLNASWTLRADQTADYVCRVLIRMQETGAAIAVPHLPKGHGLTEDDIVIFSSGYLQRARSRMPKSAGTLPWRLNQDYLEDRRNFREVPVDDGVLRFLPVAAAEEIA
ncbi:flavin-containing monooxygenase [Altericroceibacterium xinjiangense]|uniref:flavin-containing monooxygenase n=1 Tax=Altericroceibacterium xinjiangense TaxID=762261 RepID=UPI0024086D5A|nr:NAD(P)/FAD-dependent oxidoreductase [Altericroceibacterium xinjiangense]